MMDEIAKALNQIAITMDFIAVVLVVIALKDMSGSSSISHFRADVAEKLGEIIRVLKK